MILKLSIVGLFIVLIVVLTLTYYTQLEGFIATNTAALHVPQVPQLVPTPDVSSGIAASAINPQRNDVQPEVAMSDTSYNAMSLKQKSDLLTNIQKMFRNELLASRSTDASIKDTPSSSASTSSTQQGNEFNKASQKCDGPSSDEDSYRCPKNPDGSCPPVPDMTQYIKKDAIPCWGCSVDY